MASTVRMFLVTETGLRHLSRRVMKELYDGAPSLPEYAGTRQPIIEVFITFENKKPQQIIDMRGLWYKFDDRGGLGDRERAKQRRALSDKERQLVYAVLWGKNVIPLS